MARRLHMGLRNRYEGLVTFVRQVFPWVIKAMRMIATSMLETLMSLWKGVPQTSEEIADHWLDRAHEDPESNFLTVYGPSLHLAIRIVAILVIVLEWLCDAGVGCSRQLLDRHTQRHPDDR